MRAWKGGWRHWREGGSCESMTGARWGSAARRWRRATSSSPSAESGRGMTRTGRRGAEEGVFLEASSEETLRAFRGRVEIAESVAVGLVVVRAEDAAADGSGESRCLGEEEEEEEGDVDWAERRGASSMGLAEAEGSKRRRNRVPRGGDGGGISILQGNQPDPSFHVVAHSRFFFHFHPKQHPPVTK